MNELSNRSGERRASPAEVSVCEGDHKIRQAMKDLQGQIVSLEKSVAELGEALTPVRTPQPPAACGDFPDKDVASLPSHSYLLEEIARASRAVSNVHRLTTTIRAELEL